MTQALVLNLMHRDLPLVVNLLLDRTVIVQQHDTPFVSMRMAPAFIECDSDFNVRAVFDSDGFTLSFEGQTDEFQYGAIYSIDDYNVLKKWLISLELPRPSEGYF